jgi:hypothetical protein
MPFDEVFSARKKVRRIKTTEFQNLGFSGRYISAIENKGLLPERDELDIIVSFMGGVALEQGSDKVLEEQGLFGAWWESRLNQAGLDPEKTSALSEQFIALDPESQEFLFDAMKQGTEGLSPADI